ncbi:pleckstrin homology domain-containing family D member 1-like isoform X1 [Biomphalaria glabrata]|uniref:Pleckstrin homology domain-containing family D member 1-like isoform X1 n=1 Tax=Biomphalaria glabrata TaxID=6526 RepID=A0A2C9LLP1_BIOGL|nr:pleckstrin homology domain-containing family D member 1-like isoform X1 [Biomphalaria glabrata]XP_055879169.1 pleckstrin homology domain-containing family D member 1-like isoform X1 [Biomphalaria glabrata]XP_055879171.1 pleckstrin homology domain-containing family D member 1-like isoform X1 [Biomphalaria glabrata]XP_055879172.1 pleckstrin homology domain-containing family D member 1-like isoform X1 [Biomphalaria glabrata]XP_055879173.1 pleckstrin homology domain-containing family D member 1-
MNNNMPELSRRASSRDWATRIQIHGVLLKKPFAHQSSKWSKRFFLVKDGFLMYYDANEKKDYERREFFNIHPKGVMPLGECHFKICREPQQPFCIQIESPEIGGRLILSAESEYERDRWLEILERSRRVTWKNTQLGDEMIRRLEDQGLQMAIEKQNYIDRLQSEVLALTEEKIKTEELEKVNQELEKEKVKLESFTKEIKEEYERIKQELDETNQLAREYEKDRVLLSQSLDQQRQQLENLNKDKQRIIEELELSMAEQSNLSKEKQSLSQRSELLQKQLQDIENQTKMVEEEKVSAEMMLKDNQERLDQLEEEKEAIAEHAQELESTIQDLVSQKAITEKELKEEVRARIAAEQKLKEAEHSLQCLDKAVISQSHRIESEAKEEMTINVKKLKHFFEDLAQEAKISSENPLILRNGLMARKTLARRAKTVRYENRKRSSSVNSDRDNYTMSCDLSSLRPKTTLRRAVTSMDRATKEQLTALAPITENSF